jgi:hypothetical protein
MSIKEIIQQLRVTMDDARGQESHFDSWLTQNEGICQAIDSLKILDTPPAAQRPWVGLEAEEVLDLFDVNNVYGSKWIEFARTVEAKLKEKNNV